MKTHLIGITFLVCLFSNSGSNAEIVLTQEQEKKVAKIDAVLNFYHEQGTLNGTVLVAEAGKVIYQNGFGYANMDTKEELEPKSVFRLASVTKQFTAMCIMMLKEQGKLDYDDDFQKYIPELKYEGVTIRHLLGHTSGMPDYLEIMTERWAPDELYVNDDVLKIMAKYPVEKDFESGEKYEYSNTGYLLLASIVERVSGLSFKEFVKQNIFDKIGMSSSTVPIGEKGFGEIPNRVLGYKMTRNGGHVDDDYTHCNAYGDGGLFSNVMDMFRWNEALYTEKLVKKETMEEAYKPYVLNDGSVGNYGFGWTVNEIGSNKIAAHSGSWIGFRTHIFRDRTNKHCVIVLTSVGNRSGTSLYNACYNILMDKPYLRIIGVDEERRQRRR